jgi:hypothetical protein
LANEIEAQGVGRKVVADMFGMALRAYQKKVQRLTESASVRDKTLWEAVLEFVGQHAPVVRARVLERFERDGERETIAVLTDLVNSGLIYSSGRGAASLYGVTTASERERLTQEADAESLRGMLWGLVYRSPDIDSETMQQLVKCTPELFQTVMDQLVDEGRVNRVQEASQTRYRATHFLVPVGTELGWESAVLDHFQAVTRAIGTKLERGLLRSNSRDVLGGSTLRFQITSEHPYAERVLSTLGRVRAEIEELWQEVSRHNDAHPIALEERIDVCFYYGQSVHGGEWGALRPQLGSSKKPSP